MTFDHFHEFHQFQFWYKLYQQLESESNLPKLINFCFGLVLEKKDLDDKEKEKEKNNIEVVPIEKNTKFSQKNKFLLFSCFISQISCSFT